MISHLERVDYKAFIGLDWADDKHDVCVQDGVTGKREFAVIRHDIHEIESWAKGLHQRFGGQIAIAIELSKGPIVYALQHFDFFTIVPINPTTLAKYRTAFKSSKAKDDPTDAEFALELMLRYPEHFKPLELQSIKMRTLMFLVEHRRKLVDDKQRIINQIINVLKQYYPEVLEMFDHRDSQAFCAFILRWPTCQHAKRVRISTFRKFFHDHEVYKQTSIERRISIIQDAIPLTDDEAVIGTHSPLATIYAKRISEAMANIHHYDKLISDVMSALPDADIFEGLPGAGKCLSPRLLAAFGDQRDRFNSAKEVQQYAGIAPVTQRSGKKTWVHWRWHSSKFLRQSFIEWADHSRRESYWANQYYLKQRASGSTHQVAVRALAFKWIRIVYRCWKDSKPYNEVRYLNALKERGSPLVND